MKKILTIGPILPQWSEIYSFNKHLQFLSKNYAIDFIDPLEDVHDDIDPKLFFNNWIAKLENIFLQYDIFFGFSLGGIILQHCFNVLAIYKKPIILFSTPSFSDNLLCMRFDKILSLIKEKSIHAAIKTLNNYVQYPHVGVCNFTLDNPEKAALRLSKGLQFVKSNDRRHMLSKTSMRYLHLIGEKSKLVNINNVIASTNSNIFVIPNSGMRVLQDNLPICIKHINKFLKDHI